MVYACDCTRKEIADSSIRGIEGPVYPGTCRAGARAGRGVRALRVRTDRAVIHFEDRLQGAQRSVLETDIGDYVVRRADGFYAYQLAVVIDDAEQGISEVVRGADLLTSTVRQIHLQQLLGLPIPEYLHLPTALNSQGEKLSKQTLANPLSKARPVPVLWRVLAFLGQQPPNDWQSLGIPEFWAAAIGRWSESAIPRQLGIILQAPE